MTNEALRISAEQGKGRAGKLDMLNYLAGKRLTRRYAIRAKCYDCDGMGETGQCEITTCSLYPFSPYKEKTAKKKVSGNATMRFKSANATLEGVTGINATK